MSNRNHSSSCQQNAGSSGPHPSQQENRGKAGNKKGRRPNSYHVNKSRISYFRPSNDYHPPSNSYYPHHQNHTNYHPHYPVNHIYHQTPSYNSSNYYHHPYNQPANPPVQSYNSHHTQPVSMPIPTPPSLPIPFPPLKQSTYNNNDATNRTLMSYYGNSYLHEQQNTRKHESSGLTLDKPPSKSLSESINAERFIPKQKLQQWNLIPEQLLAIFPRGMVNSSGGIRQGQPKMEAELHRWLLDPQLKRSPFDLSAVNIIQYINNLRFQEYSANYLHMNVFVHHQQSIVTTYNQMKKNCDVVKIVEQQFDNFADRMEQSVKSDEKKCDLQHFDSGRIVSTTPECLARVCDEYHEAFLKHEDKPNDESTTKLLTDLKGKHEAICRDYITRMKMLIDVERIQLQDDLNAYDIYSCKFDCIEIAPPQETRHSFCDACQSRSFSRRKIKKFCAYHKTLACIATLVGKDNNIDVFQDLERRRGHNKASIIHHQSQFDCIDSILSSLQPKGDKIVAHLTFPGCAENRPRVNIGDLLRFRFGEIECIGEVGDVEIKTEKVLVFLPCPSSINTAYTYALSNPKNRPGGDDINGRFDVRFGLFGQRSFDVFDSIIKRALKEPLQLQRVLGPTIGLGDLTKKSDRRLQIGISNWVTNVNAEQKQAVFDIVRKNNGSAPYLIYGPPGTGKTMTVVESIIQILRSETSAKILVCAPSDVACDVIAKRLLPIIPTISSGEQKILRVNWWSRHPSSLPPVLLQVSSTNSSGFFTLPSEEEMKSASVIICQCFVTFGLEIGCIPWMADHFTHVFIDECSQSFEYEALVPLLTVGIGCNIIIAGDPKQLGPTVHSITANRSGLSLSLQERLLGLSLYVPTSEYCVITTLLNNYRSHDTLLKIPSTLFYDGSLVCKASPNKTTICEDFELLHDGNFPLMVYDVSKGQERNKLDTPSFYNIEECDAIVQLINALINSKNINVNTSQIAVITAFRAQVLKLREVLRKNNLSAINVGVTEDFQGQETDVILISTVLTKNNERWKIGSTGALGFMADPKRFNVAITRASSLCVIIGNVSFLEGSDTYWTALIEHVRNNNGITGDYDMTTDFDDTDNHDEDYGISQFIKTVEDLDLCLGSGHEEDRYDLHMRGYFQDAPEWRVCL